MPRRSELVQSNNLSLSTVNWEAQFGADDHGARCETTMAVFFSISLALFSAVGIRRLEDLREEHILLVCRRPGELTPGATTLAGGLKAFSPGDEARSLSIMPRKGSLCWCFLNM